MLITLKVYGLGWNCWASFGIHICHYKSSGTRITPSSRGILLVHLVSFFYPLAIFHLERSPQLAASGGTRFCGRVAWIRSSFRSHPGPNDLAALHKYKFSSMKNFFFWSRSRPRRWHGDDCWMWPPGGPAGCSMSRAGPHRARQHVNKHSCQVTEQKKWSLVLLTDLFQIHSLILIVFVGQSVSSSAYVHAAVLHHVGCVQGRWRGGRMYTLYCACPDGSDARLGILAVLCMWRRSQGPGEDKMAPSCDTY